MLKLHSNQCFFLEVFVFEVFDLSFSYFMTFLFFPLFLLSPPTFQVREEKEAELKVLLEDAKEEQLKEDRYFEAEYSAKKAELEFKNALYKYSRVKYNHKRDVTVQRNFLQPR